MDAFRDKTLWLKSVLKDVFPQSDRRDYVCVRLYRELKDRIPSAKTVPFRAASLGIANALTQVTLHISRRQMLLLQMPNVPIGMSCELQMLPG